MTTTSASHPPRAIDSATSVLLLIDFQAKLMPSISGADQAIGNARRLAEAARLLGVPVLGTEQNPRGLGANVETLRSLCGATFGKMHFDATREAGFAAFLPPGRASVVVAGCETHVCVMQTVLGLMAARRRVHLVRDAVGSRTAANRDAAIARMAAHGADLVTAEMVIFDWIGTCEHPAFKPVLGLVK